MYQEEICYFKSVLKDAYRLFSQKGNVVFSKSEMDIVTSADLDIEKYVTDRIWMRFPKDRIHGEEFHPEEPLSDRTWILDPIDGTFNFPHSHRILACKALFGIKEHFNSV